MTTFHVSEMNVIYFMYITGYNSLYLCIMIQNQQIVDANVAWKEKLSLTLQKKV